MNLVNKIWLENMMKGFDEKLGVEKRMAIMKDAEKLYSERSDEEIGEWMEQFIDRAGNPEFAEVAKELLLRNCPCNIYDWPESLDIMREIYHKSSSVYEFIDEIIKQQIWNFYYENDVIYTTKSHPCEKSSSSGKAACKSCTGCSTDIHSKIKNRCHCWMLRTIGEPKSKLFCYCGAGFYKPFFDEIWEADTKIEPVKTILCGDDDCVIAIHVPEKLRRPG